MPVAAFAVAALALLGACATMVHGGAQQVGIASTPVGARVTIDNVEAGVTPLVTSLSRKHVHVVRMELDGYYPFEGRLYRTLSPWVLADIVTIGFVFPVVVDASTGALFALQPTILSAELKRSATPVPPVAAPPPQFFWLR